MMCTVSIIVTETDELKGERDVLLRSPFNIWSSSSLFPGRHLSPWWCTEYYVLPTEQLCSFSVTVGRMIGVSSYGTTGTLQAKKVVGRFQAQAQGCLPALPMLQIPSWFWRHRGIHEGRTVGSNSRRTMPKRWASSFRLFGREDGRPPPRSRRRISIGCSFSM
jgi:hypothetical protein